MRESDSHYIKPKGRKERTVCTASIKQQTESDKIVAAALAGIGEIATFTEVTVKIIQIVENPKSTFRTTRFLRSCE